MGGIFCTPQYTYNVNGYYGLIFGDGRLLVVCIVALGAQLVWVSTLSLVLFGGMKKANILRISKEVEYEGADFHEHGGAAYQIARRKSTPGVAMTSATSTICELRSDTVPTKVEVV